MTTIRSYPSMPPRASARLVPHATLKIYPGAPHGLSDMHKDQLNTDLLAFLRS